MHALGETSLFELNLALATDLLEFEQEHRQPTVPVSELRRFKDETLHLGHGCQLGLYRLCRRQYGMNRPLPSQPHTEGVCGRSYYVELTVGLRHMLCRIHVWSVPSCLHYSLAENEQQALQCYSHLNASYRW